MNFLTRRSLLGQAGATAIVLAGGKVRAAGQPLKFGYQRSSTLLTILKQNRVLEERLGPKGFEPSWHLFNDVIPAMTARATDFHADVADAVPIFTQSAGAKLTIYAREAASPQAEAIIVPAHSAIRAIADLKGKTVGVNRGSGAHFLLAAALKRAGLSFADITPAYLTPPDAAEAFERGSIDAWSIWDPFLAIAANRHPVRQLADATGLSSYQRFYLVNDDFVAQHPEVVQTVFESLVEVGKWVKSNPAKAAAFLSPLWGNIPVEVVETVNGHRSYQVLPVDRADLSEQQTIADTFHDAGLIPKAIDATSVSLWRPILTDQ